MMNKLLKLIMILIVAVIIIAASKDSKDASKEKKSSSKKVENVVRLKDVEIKGEVKKPQAVFFLPRSKFTMEDMIVTESFIDNIEKVVDKE